MSLSPPQHRCPPPWYADVLPARSAQTCSPSARGNQREAPSRSRPAESAPRLPARTRRTSGMPTSTRRPTRGFPAGGQVALTDPDQGQAGLGRREPKTRRPGQGAGHPVPCVISPAPGRVLRPRYVRSLAATEAPALSYTVLTAHATDCSLPAPRSSPHSKFDPSPHPGDRGGSALAWRMREHEREESRRHASTHAFWHGRRFRDTPDRGQGSALPPG